MFPTIRFVMEAANKKASVQCVYYVYIYIYIYIRVDSQWLYMLELIGNIKDLCDSDEALAQKVKIGNTVA